MSQRYDARMLTSEAKESLRLRVVAAVVDQGMGPTEAARLFHVSRTAIFHWTKAYKELGAQALAKKPLGRPKEPRLKGHQAATVVRIITAGCPDQHKMPFALWTREAVQSLLQRRFGLKVSVWTVGRYLKGWGLTPQKPVRRAYEQNPAAVKRWLQEEYPAIKRRAAKEKAEIHWGDQMGLRSEHQSGTTWAKRGQTPVVESPGKRFGCNMISTITNRGVLRFMVFRKNFATPILLVFLKRLLRSVKSKVFLILDHHPVHRAKAVDRWLEEHADKIERFYLPDYSPQLNPDELLNQETKSHAHRLGGNRRLRLFGVHELPPRMRPAPGPANAAGDHHPVVAAIGIGQKRLLVTLEELRRPIARPAEGEVEHVVWIRFISDVHPHPRLPGFLRRQHRHHRVVGAHQVRFQHTLDH
jgi:transposase